LVEKCSQEKVTYWLSQLTIVETDIEDACYIDVVATDHVQQETFQEVNAACTTIQ